MDSSKLPLKDWVKMKLSEFLDFDVPDLLAGTVLSKKDEELEDYLKDLLDVTDIKTVEFIKELVKRRNPEKCNTFKTGKLRQAESMWKTSSNASGKKKRKYTKNINDIFVKKSTLLEGRHPCNCEARIHKLINNCLSCGKIVCEQEGSGPCFFCDAIVCTQEEQKILNEQTEESNLLYETLALQEKPELKKVYEERERLLEYDRNYTQRMQVIDSQSEHYSWNNVWLTPEERERLQTEAEEKRKKQEKQKFQKKITIDFSKGTVTEGVNEVEGDETNDTNDGEGPITSSVKDKATISSAEVDVTELEKLFDTLYPTEKIGDLKKPDNKFSVPSIITAIGTVYHTSCLLEDKAFIKKQYEEIKRLNRQDAVDHCQIRRVKDGQYNRTDDTGMCLSVHQPFASLLVSGVKTHEGRSWYTEHRGTLWIASTSKHVSEEEIRHCQNFYRLHLGENTKFPTEYPTGVLLGCVEVSDCMCQEEYREQFPNGEVESSFVLVCENPLEMPIKLPIRGKPNIYQLDLTAHTAVKNVMKNVK